MVGFALPGFQQPQPHEHSYHHTATDWSLKAEARVRVPALQWGQTVLETPLTGQLPALLPWPLNISEHHDRKLVRDTDYKIPWLEMPVLEPRKLHFHQHPRDSVAGVSSDH